MSLYSQYIKEREDFEIVETNEGFATFKCVGPECYIRDIYVTSQGRKAGHASFMADKISSLAKERGCQFLVGTVCPQSKGATESLMVLLAYGFRLVKSDTNLIYFKKDLI